MKERDIQKIPLPVGLRKLLREATRPVFLCSRETAALMEHWGFTANGHEFVRKLVRCGALKHFQFKHQRGWRFRTMDVLGYYQREVE
jgi:hypothetical protein